MVDGLPLVPSAELRSRVLAAASREWAPTRRTIGLARCFLASAMALELILFFLTLGGVHLGERSVTLVVGTTLGWTGVAVLATAVVFGRRSMAGRSRRWLVATATGGPAVLLTWTVFWTIAMPGYGLAVPGFSKTADLLCLDLTLAMGLLPMLSVLLFQRRSRPQYPGALGAATGTVLGAWAGLVVNFTCPSAHVPHVATAHVLPVAVLAAVGLWLGRGLSR